LGFVSVQLEVVKLYDCNVEFRAFDNLIVNSSLRSLLLEEITEVWYK